MISGIFKLSRVPVVCHARAGARQNGVIRDHGGELEALRRDLLVFSPCMEANQQVVFSCRWWVG